MFNEIDYDKAIPPNFLNSILTNNSLYVMFRDDFEENKTYFQGIEKEVYLKEMLKFIEDMLFSSNVFHIYKEVEDLDEATCGKLQFVKNFYDDFLLDEFKRDPKSILKIRFFRGMEYTKRHDKYAPSSEEFLKLYDYVFKESLDYKDIVSVLIKEPIASIKNGETLSFADFDLVSNYVKNNIDGTVDMELVCALLYNHAYKKNHIFDMKVAEEIVSSTIRDYLSTYDISVDIEFVNGLDSGEVSSHDVEDMKITFDESLLEGFISLNYIDLFETAFFEAHRIVEFVLLKRNECNMATLRVIMNMVSFKVDVLEFLKTQEVTSEYEMDARATSFISALRFFASFGVNLLNSFIQSKLSSFEIKDTKEVAYSKKEISLDQRFFLAFKDIPNKRELIHEFEVLKVIFNADGSRKGIKDIIKHLKDDSRGKMIIDYLHSRVVEPEVMIEDVEDLSRMRPKDTAMREFIENELKYIYVDTFFYSLDSFLKLNDGVGFDKDEYLEDLAFKVNCICDTSLTHRFKDEALFTISEVQQS